MPVRFVDGPSVGGGSGGGWRTPKERVADARWWARVAGRPVSSWAWPASGVRNRRLRRRWLDVLLATGACGSTERPQSPSATICCMGSLWYARPPYWPERASHSRRDSPLIRLLHSHVLALALALALPLPLMHTHTLEFWTSCSCGFRCPYSPPHQKIRSIDHSYSFHHDSPALDPSASMRSRRTIRVASGLFWPSGIADAGRAGLSAAPGRLPMHLPKLLLRYARIPFPTARSPRQFSEVRPEASCRSVRAGRASVSTVCPSGGLSLTGAFSRTRAGGRL